MAYNQDENFYSKSVHTLPDSGLISEHHCGQCQQAGAEYVASETKVPYCNEACARVHMNKRSFGDVNFGEPSLLCGYNIKSGSTGVCAGCYQQPVARAVAMDLQDGQKALIGVCVSDACCRSVQDCGIHTMDKLKCWLARMRLFRPYRKCHIVAAALMLQDCPETMAHVLPILYDKVYFDPLHYNRFIAFVHAQLDAAIKAMPTPTPSGVTCKQQRPYTDPRFVARLLLRMYKLYGKPTCDICRDLETLRCDVQSSLLRLVGIVGSVQEADRLMRQVLFAPVPPPEKPVPAPADTKGAAEQMIGDRFYPGYGGRGWGYRGYGWGGGLALARDAVAGTAVALGAAASPWSLPPGYYPPPPVPVGEKLIERPYGYGYGFPDRGWGYPGPYYGPPGGYYGPPYYPHRPHQRWILGSINDDANAPPQETQTAKWVRRLEEQPLSPQELASCMVVGAALDGRWEAEEGPAESSGVESISSNLPDDNNSNNDNWLVSFARSSLRFMLGHIMLARIFAGRIKFQSSNKRSYESSAALLREIFAGTPQRQLIEDELLHPLEALLAGVIPSVSTTPAAELTKDVNLVQVIEFARLMLRDQAALARFFQHPEDDNSKAFIGYLNDSLRNANNLCDYLGRYADASANSSKLVAPIGVNPFSWVKKKVTKAYHYVGDKKDRLLTGKNYTIGTLESKIYKLFLANNCGADQAVAEAQWDTAIAQARLEMDDYARQMFAKNLQAQPGTDINKEAELSVREFHRLAQQALGNILQRKLQKGKLRGSMTEGTYSDKQQQRMGKQDASMERERARLCAKKTGVAALSRQALQVNQEKTSTLTFSCRHCPGSWRWSLAR
jgi:hypothetical protein